MKIRIHALHSQYLDAAVELHLQAFPNFFLSRLGRGFVLELYRAYVARPKAVGLVAVDEAGDVHGVLLGTSEPEGFYRRLLFCRGWAFALASVPVLLRHPVIVGRLLRAVRYRGREKQQPLGALLSSIAVDPSDQRLGIGRMLVQDWLQRIRAAGCSRAYLTTDAGGNEAVNLFYQRLGWTLDKTYATPEGRRMNRYVFIW